MTVNIHDYLTDDVMFGGIDSSLISNTTITLNPVYTRLACLYLLVFHNSDTIEGLKDIIKSKVYPTLVPFISNNSKNPTFEISNSRQIEAKLEAIPMEIFIKGEDLDLDYYSGDQSHITTIICELIADSIVSFKITKHDSLFFTESPEFKDLIDHNPKSVAKSGGIGSGKNLSFAQNFYSLPSTTDAVEEWFVDKDDEKHPNNITHDLSFTALFQQGSLNSGFVFKSEKMVDPKIQAKQFSLFSFDLKNPVDYSFYALKLSTHYYCKKYLVYISFMQARDIKDVIGGDVVYYYESLLDWATLSKDSDPIKAIMRKYSCSLAKASKLLYIFMKYQQLSLDIDMLRSLPALPNHTLNRP